MGEFRCSFVVAFHIVDHQLKGVGGDLGDKKDHNKGFASVCTLDHLPPFCLILTHQPPQDNSLQTDITAVFSVLLKDCYFLPSVL